MNETAFEIVQFTDVHGDLDDLDLLDDDRRHALCLMCHPARPGLGVPFTAICGRRAIHWHHVVDPYVIPPDACLECAVRFNRPCPNGHGI